MQKPFVYIVGAGPGDPELLTRKAYRLITETADIVIYDRLISEEIIALIPASIAKIYVGKACGKPSPCQEDIHALLLEEAAKGKTIVRLKGGDPGIFGRGGEEAELLWQHHIPFEIVPGVTAASGCAAILGIPLTHRGIATSVRFITGHSQNNEQVAYDWKALTDPTTTLVVYMGLANIEKVTESLKAAGMPKDMPVAVIHAGTTRAQTTCITTLDAVVPKIKECSFTAPILLIIGRVVGLPHVHH